MSETSWIYDLLRTTEVRDHDYERAFEKLDRELSASERPVAQAAWRKLHRGGAFAPVFRRVTLCQGFLAQHVADVEAQAEGGA